MASVPARGYRFIAEARRPKIGRAEQFPARSPGTMVGRARELASLLSGLDEDYPVNPLSEGARIRIPEAKRGAEAIARWAISDSGNTAYFGIYRLGREPLAKTTVGGFAV